MFTLNMTKILAKNSIEIIRADGLRVFFEQALRFLSLYGSPGKVARYWWLKLRGQDVHTVSVQGSMMTLNIRDRGIHSDLFINRIREPQATQYLQSIIRPEWVVADIGANIGYYALMQGKTVRRVYALEPSVDNYKALTANVLLNGYGEVITCYNTAVGDRSGSAGFYLAGACNWNRIAVGDDRVDTQVPMTTLDEFVKENVEGGAVDFLRMDVEGYEMDILRGGNGVLKEVRPRMFIEVHRDLLRDYGYSQLKFMQLLAEHGYWIEKSYISARPGPTGEIKVLLKDPGTRKAITERGIASHMFFSPGGDR